MVGDVDNPNLKWMITRGTLMTFRKPPKIDGSKSMDPMNPAVPAGRSADHLLLLILNILDKATLIYQISFSSI